MKNNNTIISYKRRYKDDKQRSANLHSSLCSGKNTEADAKEEIIQPVAPENPDEDFGKTKENQKRGNNNDGTLKTRVRRYQFYERRRRKHTKVFESADSEEVSTSAETCSKVTRICDRNSPLRKKMSDHLFQHCLESIWRETPEEKRNQCIYFDSFIFHMHTVEDARENALQWIKKRDVFSKTYVFVPVVLWDHWSLLILCHLGENQESERTPCVLLLDSLHEYGSSQNLKPKIKGLVSDIFRVAKRQESLDEIEKIPILVPLVPQQRNGVECGIYSLFFAERFLANAPENFSVSRGYPYFMKEDWFNEDEVEAFYDRLEGFGPFKDD